MGKLTEIAAHVLGKDYCERHDGIVDETAQYSDPDTGETTENWCKECSFVLREDYGWVKVRSASDPK